MPLDLPPIRAITADPPRAGANERKPRTRRGFKVVMETFTYRPHVAAYPAGRFIAPCLPTKTDKLPSGSGWLHEINHDGFRVIARKNGAHYSRARLASPRPSSPKRNNFSTTDSGRLFLYKVDADSQPECNAHRDHRSGSVRNARQGHANPESSWRIGVPLVGFRTYAPKRYEPLRASHGCAQDSKRGPRGAGYHERMPVMLG